MDAQQAVDRYKAELGAFEAAAEAIKPLLTEVCRRAGVLGAVDARAKDIASYVKKAHLKRGKYTDFWAEVTDKLGARLILETRHDRDRALAALLAAHDLFPTIGEPDDKSAGINPEDLAYPGVHVQVVVPGVTLSDGEAIECEVQVRTKAEDLWSVPSHRLLYKPLVPPPWLAARRIWRLRTLVEVFDEEVDRAMTEVASQPGQEAAALLRLAEHAYYTFVSVPGDEALSIDVLSALTDAIEAGERDGYPTALEDFVAANRDKLAAVYRDYGAGSSFDALFEYFLFTQPESVVIFERIERRPALLRAVGEHGDIWPALVPMFEAWGVPT